MISYDAILAAAERLSGICVETPLLENEWINARVGTRVLLKAEGLQRSGSFKLRGAYNRLSQLSGAERKQGVVAWSSGNHAQGVAYAARLLAMRATIVMPSDAPRIKIANTQRLGAEVVLYDRERESREEIATRLTEERGSTLVPSFEDAHIMAGQGTVGLEVTRQAEAAGADLGHVLVPCGGGGLIAGVATAMKATMPNVDIYAVEPALFDDTTRSLAAGTRQRNERVSGSICDALLAPTPGEMTFAVNQRLLTGGLTVDDAAVKRAMVCAFERLKLVVEPGGAVALAALLEGQLPHTEKAIAVVLSGANVDPHLFAQILAGTA